MSTVFTYAFRFQPPLCPPFMSSPEPTHPLNFNVSSAYLFRYPASLFCVAYCRILL